MDPSLRVCPGRSPAHCGSSTRASYASSLVHSTWTEPNSGSRTPLRTAALQYVKSVVVKNQALLIYVYRPICRFCLFISRRFSVNTVDPDCHIAAIRASPVRHRFRLAAHWGTSREDSRAIICRHELIRVAGRFTHIHCSLGSDDSYTAWRSWIYAYFILFILLFIRQNW